jgi:hypothetical protein
MDERYSLLICGNIWHKMKLQLSVGVGYCVTFPWMKYDCKRGPVWVPINIATCPCFFEVICHHCPFKTSFPPLIPKARYCSYIPKILSQNE